MNLGSNSGGGGRGALDMSLSIPEPQFAMAGSCTWGAQHPAPSKADKLVAECSYLGGVAMSSLPGSLASQPAPWIVTPLPHL